MPKLKIDISTLKDRLFYNQETGIFVWRAYKHAKRVGKPAGIVHPNGYVIIHLKPFGQYRAHRLAWFYMTGEWPKDQIDHINRIKTDNRFSNLREANASDQQMNVSLSSRNKSGMRGVCLTSNKKAWRAVIWINGRSIHLGTFPTKEEASEVYLSKAKESNFNLITN